MLKNVYTRNLAAAKRRLSIGDSSEHRLNMAPLLKIANFAQWRCELRK